MRTLLLFTIALGAVACSTTTSYDQVEVVGLKDCRGQWYVNPIRVRITTGADDGAYYTLMGGARAETVAFNRDKKTTSRVRVGVCGNRFGEASNYTCTEPKKWYFDQEFTYDPKSPQKLAVPQPDGGQPCTKPQQP